MDYLQDLKLYLISIFYTTSQHVEDFIFFKYKPQFEEALVIGFLIGGVFFTLLFIFSDPRRQKENKILKDANETLQLIKARRSIFPKDYNGNNVPEDYINLMLEASNWAPTHGLTQPWRYVLIRCKEEGKKGGSKDLQEYLDINAMELRRKKGKDGKVDEEIEKKISKKSKELINCSHLIFIIQKKVLNNKGFYMPEWEETASVAMSVQNMHLVATSLNIGAYWSSGGWDSVLMSENMRRFLSLEEEGDKCLGVFHVGYSDKIGGYRGTRGPIKDKVKWKGLSLEMVDNYEE